MKNSTLSESQITKALMEYKGGYLIKNVFRELSVVRSTFGAWKRQQE